MILEINGTDYEMRFGLGFLKEINKGRESTTNNVDVRLGVENAVSALYTGDYLPLLDLIKAGTITEKQKPKDKEIDEFLMEADLEELANDFLEELRTQSATKKKAERVLKSIKEAEEI